MNSKKVISGRLKIGLLRMITTAYDNATLVKICHHYTHLRKPASNTNCPAGDQKICDAVFLSIVSMTFK